MAKQGANANTRSGGHVAQVRFRDIVADPDGNREQRRAARKLGVTAPSDTPKCPHCGRTSHGLACDTAPADGGAPC